MMRKRNYDLLRVVASIAVVMLHVSAPYVNGMSIETSSKADMLITCVYRACTCFAVPCFMMLSGAFLLSDERNVDYRYFYKKTFKSIGIPTLIFSALYTLFSLCLEVFRSISKNGTEDFLVPIINLLKGEPFYHMWYLFMLAGVYVLVPVVLNVKDSIGENNFRKMSWVFLLLACPSGWTIAGSPLKWNIGYSFCFLGYLMIGYIVRKMTEGKENSGKGIWFLLSGIAVMLIIAVLRYIQAIKGIGDNELEFSLLGPFNPLVVLASILIFFGGALVEVKIEASSLSALSFYIYLFHAGVLFVLQRLVVFIDDKMNIICIIPLLTLLVYGISMVASKIYIKVFNRIKLYIKKQRDFK